MKTVRERSMQEFRFIFEDKNLRRFAPSTVRYRLDDTTNGCKTTIIDWTSVTPEPEIDIQIPSNANRILNTTNAFEMRTITVESDYDTVLQMSEDLEYRVKNLKGFQ